jgi:hypothetical protein
LPTIPFTAYDFFAYLSAGFVVIGAGAFAYRGTAVADAEIGFVEGVVLIVVAYVLGHVISALSAPLLERRFAEDRLGERQELLLASQEQPRAKGWDETLAQRLFRAYFSPLPQEIRTLVLERAKGEAKITTVGRALFLYCDAKERQNPQAAPVLAIYLNIYGFARNACFASAVGFLLLLLGVWRYETDRDVKALLAFGTIVAAVGLLYRYLKFFRLYAREVFLFYASEKADQDASMDGLKNPA